MFDTAGGIADSVFFRVGFNSAILEIKGSQWSVTMKEGEGPQVQFLNAMESF